LHVPIPASVVPKKTPAQLFAHIFKIFVDKNTTQGERDNAERKLDAWLKTGKLARTSPRFWFKLQPTMP
jgi:hypothetical protein